MGGETTALETQARFLHVPIEAVFEALIFKTDVLWAQLDALHHAYVEPGHIPPGAFVPDDHPT